MSGKLKALLDYKNKLLQETKYYDNRIDEVRLCSTIFDYELDPGSDSDNDILPQIDTSPSIAELKQLQSMTKTCLEATLELGTLTILEHGVSVVVDNPSDREDFTTEPGVWHEVISECRLDLIHFSLFFYMHKPYDTFASRTYYGLQVSLAKKLHEAELSASILNSLNKPSDAVEVIRNYAEAYRSRRTTLARLADKYSDLLHLEQMPAGGYVVRCGGLLQLQWTLENRWSPVAPFHHRTKFDLEYMDEARVNRIRVVHKRLSDPHVDTDQRTALLAEIMDICLEARQENSESGTDGTELQSSDAETAHKLVRRRTTLDAVAEGPPAPPQPHMAPPTAPPKRAKRTRLSGTHEIERILNNDLDKNDVGQGEEKIEDRNEENNIPKKSEPKKSINKGETAGLNSENMKKQATKKFEDENPSKEKDIVSLFKDIEKSTGKKDAKKRHIEETNKDLSKKRKTVDKSDNAQPKKDKNLKAKDKIEDNQEAKKRQGDQSNTGAVKKIKTTNADGNFQSSKKDNTEKDKVMSDKNKNVNRNEGVSKNTQKNIENHINKNEKNLEALKKIASEKVKVMNSAKNSAGRTDNAETEKPKNFASTSNVQKSNSDSNITKFDNQTTSGKVVKKIVKKVVTKDGKVVKQIKKIVSTTDVNKKVTSDVPSVKNKEKNINVASNKDEKTTNPQINNKKVKTSKDVINSKQPNQKVPLKISNKPKVANTERVVGNTKNVASSSKTVGRKEKENAELPKQNLVKSKLPMPKVLTKISTLPTKVSPRKPISKISSNIKKPMSPRAVAAAKLKAKVKDSTNIPKLVRKQTKTKNSDNG